MLRCISKNFSLLNKEIYMKFDVIHSIEDSLPYLWHFLSGHNKFALINFIPLLYPRVECVYYKYIGMITNDVLLNCYVPGISEYKINLIINIHFIIKDKNSIFNEVFLNYKITEKELFHNNLTMQNYKKFSKYVIENFHRQNVNIRDGYYTEINTKFSFVLGSRRVYSLNNDHVCRNYIRSPFKL